ncbi:helix-turn-helix transcriptional regulator [Christiangramia crocea]|uniref:WYL domain-containing protein n=1 Tax=Christiangramia crocea TaxID=2904124 RepID=A0A9X1UW28_9FLAO|nr:WYL domain-containing protein [Gramella crocea]MCG9971155.1 WYL domain-containing protein [Gramella crocea]
MPITKNALIRYQCLDRCFRNPGKRYYIEDLLEECNKALWELNPDSNGIRKRQLYDDITFMTSPEGWSAPIERVRDSRRTYFRYEDQNFSINNQPLNELEAEQLKSAISILDRFKGLPQFKWINQLLPKLDQAFNISNDSEGIISFDNNEYLKGIEFIGPLFNAILYKKLLEINYKSFKNPEPVEIIFSPYHLKEYNNRWFVYGKNNDFDGLINLALDRIEEIKELKGPYEFANVNFEEYFEDVIGVSIFPDQKPIKIGLRVDQSLWPYIQTKPLHGSQKTKEKGKDFTIISIEVVPNFELESIVLQFGEKIEVLEPESFRNQIKNRIIATSKKYL